MIKDIKKLFTYFGNNKGKFVLWLFISLIVHTPRYVIRAHAFKLIVDYFVYRQQDQLYNTIAVMALYLLLSIILVPITAYFNSKVSELIMRDIRVSVYNQIKKLPIDYYEKNHSGDILARVNRDVNAIKTAMSTIDNFLFHSMSVFFVIPYFIYLDYRLAIAVTITSFAAAFVNLKFVEPIRKLSKEKNEKLAKLSEILTEHITGFNIVKIFNLKKYFGKRLDTKMDDIYSSELDFVKTESKMYGINNFVHSVSYLLIVIMAAYFVITKDMEVGSLVSTTMVCGNLSFHFLRVGQNIVNIQTAFAGVDRVGEFFDEAVEPERYNTSGDNDIYGVSIKKGTFAYDKDVPVISNIDINIPRGAFAAIVGDSGAGKSTLIKLILGLYPLNEGSMSINGKPVNQYSLNELREQTSYVPQDAYIFNGTIKDNILYGRSDTAHEEMVNASIEANAHEFIIRQKDGYDTIVGERGIKLSGGQRQRIAIARAILKNSSILLLDEATSSLDSESEHMIQQALDKLMQGKTSIVIAHRLSTIQNADIIFFLKDGCIVEKGTHEQLLSSNGQYAELYNKTFIHQNESQCT
ncbi:MAG: ABC transporter ATP-binding protein [Clostridia bacterium]